MTFLNDSDNGPNEESITVDYDSQNPSRLSIHHNNNALFMNHETGRRLYTFLEHIYSRDFKA